MTWLRLMSGMFQRDPGTAKSGPSLMETRKLPWGCRAQPSASRGALWSGTAAWERNAHSCLPHRGSRQWLQGGGGFFPPSDAAVKPAIKPANPQTHTGLAQKYAAPPTHTWSHGECDVLWQASPASRPADPVWWSCGTALTSCIMSQALHRCPCVSDTAACLLGGHHDMCCGMVPENDQPTANQRCVEARMDWSPAPNPPLAAPPQQGTGSY